MSRFRDVGPFPFTRILKLQAFAADGRIPPSPDNSRPVGSYKIVCELRGGEAY